jgi:hypothetical protein
MAHTTMGFRAGPLGSAFSLRLIAPIHILAVAVNRRNPMTDEKEKPEEDEVPDDQLENAAGEPARRVCSRAD